MFFKRPSRRFIAGLFIFSACICTVISLGSLFYSWQFVRTATHAKGIVTEMVPKKDQEGETVYSPVFTFRDAQGIEHVVRASWASRPPEHQVGDSVQVLYAPSSPRDAKIDNFF